MLLSARQSRLDLATIERWGARIRLRPLRFQDMVDVFRYASDPQVTRYLGWGPHRSLLDTIEHIDQCLHADPRWLVFAVEERHTRRVIGSVDIRLLGRFARVGEIGYTISRALWGQGFNLEAAGLLLDLAFDEIGIGRALARCEVANRRSYRTMEKLGMSRDRVVRAGDPTAPYPRDRYQYSILRAVWLRRRQDLLFDLDPAAVPFRASMSPKPKITPPESRVVPQWKRHESVASPAA